MQIKNTKDRKDSRSLTAEMVRVGDIVKLKDEEFRIEVINKSRSIYNENLFTVKSLEKGQVQLDQIDGVAFNYDKIEAVLIDSREDSAIYYNLTMAADVVKANDPLPEHTTDFRNYLWQFKEIKTQGASHTTP